MSSDPADTEWTRIRVRCGPAAAEEVALLLANLTGRGVETKTPVEETGRLFVEGYLRRGPGERALLERIERGLSSLAGFCPGDEPVLAEAAQIADEDWNEDWKRSFEVSRLTKRLVVRPSWKKYTPRKGEQVVEIDPAMAFGTGLHESTRLVLRFIEELYPPRAEGPQRVLDVGTGTGILAMACALLGARAVRAIDNDPLAVAAARRNVRSNSLAGKVTVSAEDLTSIGGAFDLVTANIVHDVLVAMARDLSARLAAGGSLVCAGILAGGQEQSLATALRSCGLEVAGAKRDGEWAALQVKVFS